MKKILSFSILTFLLLALLSNKHPRQAANSYFVVLYTPGAGWDAAKQPQDQLHFRSHSSRLQAMRKENKISLGARFADKGMIVIPAGSKAEVEQWVNSDSAVMAQTFKAEVHAFNVFYYGCIEKPQ